MSILLLFTVIVEGARYVGVPLFLLFFSINHKQLLFLNYSNCNCLMSIFNIALRERNIQYWIIANSCKLPTSKLPKLFLHANPFSYIFWPLMFSPCDSCDTEFYWQGVVKTLADRSLSFLKKKSFNCFECSISMLTHTSSSCLKKTKQNVMKHRLRKKLWSENKTPHYGREIFLHSDYICSKKKINVKRVN